MTVYRKLLPGEAWRYRVHLLRLTADDRRSRFMATISNGSVEAHCAGIDWTRTVIVAAIVRGEVRATAELRGEGGSGSGMAELAVSVERDWQGQGLGTALVRRIITVARNRRVRKLGMVCLSNNRRMQRIAAKLMGPCTYDSGEVTSVVTLAPSTPLTMAQEAIDTGAVPLGILLDQWQGEGRRAA